MGSGGRKYSRCRNSSQWQSIARRVRCSRRCCRRRLRRAILTRFFFRRWSIRKSRLIYRLLRSLRLHRRSSSCLLRVGATNRSQRRRLDCLLGKSRSRRGCWSLGTLIAPPPAREDEVRPMYLLDGEILNSSVVFWECLNDCSGRETFVTVPEARDQMWK